MSLMRQTMQIQHLSLKNRRIPPNLFGLSPFHHSFTQIAKKLEYDGAPDPPYVDLPKPRERESNRKPYPTPMKILIQRAKEKRVARKAQPCRMLEHPPDNGLLVPDLVHVAHDVYLAWKLLRSGILRLVEAIPIQRCRCCCMICYIFFCIHFLFRCDASYPLPILKFKLYLDALLLNCDY